ncbi:MAG: chemotaxis protein CheW [Acetatifactor sp.]
MAEEFNVDGMLDMFLYESGQLLEKLEGIILEKQDADCFDDTDINEIFRIMHTIKGSSGIMMYDNITKVTHKLEDVFYYLRESHPENVPHLELVEKVLAVSDFVNGEMDKIKDGEKPDGDEKEILEDLDEFLKRIKGEIKEQGIRLPRENKHEEPTQFYIAPVASEDSKFYRIAIHYKNDTQMSNIRAYSATYALKEVAEDLLYTPEDIITNEESANVILSEGFYMLLQTKSEKEEILGLIDSSEANQIDIERITAEQFTKGFGNSTEPEEPKVVIDLGEEPPAEKPKAVAPGDYVIKAKETGKGKTLAKNQPKQQSIISINVEKMDMLMDLIGEIVIAEAVVLQNPDLQGMDLPNFQKASAQLAKITTELQEVIMSMRMMPLTNVFQKMRRIVFDVSKKLGKEIELEVIGESTEVDKNIIEHISDPLMHLVRNSVDHGIECDAEERVALGKPRKGKIVLEARNEGGKVYVSVRDDGKGLDKQKLFEKARDKGLLGSKDKEITDYTDNEIYRFITLPGFSTKEQVTEYSGRGVGMDVVVKNIQSIGGRLEISSELNRGSEMRLVIPLTLAIINGIVIQAGSSSFVIETASVKEFVRLTEKSIVTEPDGEEYVILRGEAYPFLRLSRRFELENALEKVDDGIVMVLEHENKQVCVLIDKLVREQEIVVKPIPSYVKKVKGISGCTQLGDGSIALILDIGGLIQEEEGR